MQVAALAEPLAAVINGQEQVDVRDGDTVLVLGAGPIGLLHLQLARARGAAAVIVSEPSEARREAAAALGASLVIDPTTEDVVAASRQATDGLGSDVAIVAIGIPAVAETAIEAVRRGGRVDLFAGFDPGSRLSLDPSRVHYDELVIAGATASTRRQFGEAVELLASGAIAGPELLSESFPLDRLGEALERVRSGAGRKILITP
jgi:L-iditol 2-dehydrogenase